MHKEKSLTKRKVITGTLSFFDTDKEFGVFVNEKYDSWISAGDVQLALCGLEKEIQNDKYDNWTYFLRKLEKWFPLLRISYEKTGTSPTE